MDSVDCVVVGAGAVGLAVARALAQRGLETIVVEAQRHIGTGESSRNSEVIHAGIYYPEGSLKAQFCVAGRKALYAYCEARGIAHRRCGKLIVATTTAQVEQLAALRAFAAAAGVDDLVPLTANQARRLEPDLHCVAALESPSTGILDSHAYMLALQGDAEAAGAAFAFETPVTRLWQESRSIELTLGQDSAPSLRARLLVNCAGLNAQAVALSLAELPRRSVPTLHYAKGNYFSLSTRSPFTRLIYPLPQVGGLGVHLTLDLDGRARFGPDVEWIDAPDYHVDPARSSGFYEAIRMYWPALRDGSLLPGYAGVRAKLGGPGHKAADFLISGPTDHGIPGLINLFGIESPGLTSSLAIAAHVASMANEHVGGR
jgi:L-2-hydroxyglutarate oxidase LhgO